MVATIIFGILGFLGVLATIFVSISIAIRAERKQSEEKMAELLRQMVSEKLDALSKDFTAFGRRLTVLERKHERMVGRLEGKGLLEIRDSMDEEAN